MMNPLARTAVAAVLLGSCLAGGTALLPQAQAQEPDQPVAAAHVAARLSGAVAPTTSDGASGDLLEIPATAQCAVQGDLEGRFTQDQMPELLSCVVPMVDGWIDTVYADMPHPVAYEFVPAGVQGSSLGCKYDDTTFAYCLADQKVYVGEASTWGFYSQTGDASVAFALAHEVTHHFQTEAGVFDAVDASADSTSTYQQLTVATENQADCGGGAFLNYLDAQGGIDMADDVSDIDAVMPQIASAEGPDRDHGTLDERVASFNDGWLSTDEQPLTACNAFFPNVPLVTP
jgi:uncharacterized protein